MCSCNDEKKPKKIRMEYAKAYVLPQAYKDLVNIKFVFETGTIFKDLICPYHGNK